MKGERREGQPWEVPFLAERHRRRIPRAFRGREPWLREGLGKLTKMDENSPSAYSAVTFQEPKNKGEARIVNTGQPRQTRVRLPPGLPVSSSGC